MLTLENSPQCLSHFQWLWGLAVGQLDNQIPVCVEFNTMAADCTTPILHDLSVCPWERTLWGWTLRKSTSWSDIHCLGRNHSHLDTALSRTWSKKQSLVILAHKVKEAWKSVQKDRFTVKQKGNSNAYRQVYHISLVLLDKLSTSLLSSSGYCWALTVLGTIVISHLGLSLDLIVWVRYRENQKKGSDY